jgi:hypothetical protein
MQCVKCEKEVDEQLYENIKNLPLMTGFNFNPSEKHEFVFPCAFCKKPVCGSCVYGHGYFIFTCLGTCTEKFVERCK